VLNKVEVVTRIRAVLFSFSVGRNLTPNSRKEFPRNLNGMPLGTPTEFAVLVTVLSGKLNIAC